MADMLPQTPVQQAESAQPSLLSAERTTNQVTALGDVKDSIEHNYGELFAHKHELLIVTQKKGRGKYKEGTWTAHVLEMKSRPRHTGLHAEGKSKSEAIRNLHRKPVGILEKVVGVVRSSLMRGPGSQSGRRKHWRRGGKNPYELSDEDTDKDGDEDDEDDEDDDDDDEDGNIDGDGKHGQGDPYPYMPNLERPPAIIPLEYPLPASVAVYLVGPMIDVKFDISTAMYGDITVLEKTEFDYYHVDKTVRTIFRRRFPHFSSNPTTPLSDEEIDRLPLKFCFVVIDGKVIELGDDVTNWRSLKVYSTDHSVAVAVYVP
ncbi:hypothetical protein E4U42_000298 [Claviceps africana]|uniref:Uncharacterized protein n=1 Tax=Claviceps africana TaxID=83212 RepID=A0A8K0NFL8_9HYPO|nr:hypothetical protein E4U42_000298 [Claviceps africana]